MFDADPSALTELQRRILQALLVEGALSTSQLILYILPDLRNWQIYRALDRLRTCGLVRSSPLYPQRGSNSELCWRACAQGAQALGQPWPHTHRPYRQPTPMQIDHKTHDPGGGS